METLKKYFPMSWKYTKDIPNLIIGIITYLVVGLIAGAVLAISGLITGWIPLIGGIIGIVLGLIGGLVEIYVVAGIVIQILVYTKVIND